MEYRPYLGSGMVLGHQAWTGLQVNRELSRWAGYKIGLSGQLQMNLSKKNCLLKVLTALIILNIFYSAKRKFGHEKTDSLKKSSQRQKKLIPYTEKSGQIP